MIAHIIHSSILAFLFYSVYQVFLRKETFFQWNRFYLLAIPLLSIMIPFLSAPFQIDLAPAVNEVMVPDTIINSSQAITIGEMTTPMDTSQPIDYMMILFVFYGIGVFISLLSFIYKLSKINQIISNGIQTYSNGILITKTSQKLTAFSFFKNVVVDEQLDDIKIQDVIDHELIHVKQFHSWDLMAYEICKMLFWFHPISYLAQKELKQIHEFIVDRLLLKNAEPKAYQESLLRTVFGTERFTLTSSYFNKSLLKNRIIMLQKKKSTSTSLFKLAFILPIVLVSLIFTACNEEKIGALDSTELIAETDSNFIPRLSKFEYGQKDLYKGLSEDDISFHESFLNHDKNDSIPEKNVSDIIKMIKSEDGKRWMDITLKITKNGETLIVDDVNEIFNIIIIQEQVNKEPIYMTASEEWNSNSIHSYVEGFLLGAGKDKVSELDDDVYKNMMALVVQLKEKKPIETIVEETSGSSYSKVYHGDEVPFAIMEIAPQFPGKSCEGTIEDQKKCFKDALSVIVSENFDKSNFELTPGVYKITCQFKIDTDGNIKDIKTRARSPELADEATRVLNLLPQMIPGSHQGQKVIAVYALPIKFEIK